jgi:hypothetical protein
MSISVIKWEVSLATKQIVIVESIEIEMYKWHEAQIVNYKQSQYDFKKINSVALIVVHDTKDNINFDKHITIL